MRAKSILLFLSSLLFACAVAGGAPLRVFIRAGVKTHGPTNTIIRVSSRNGPHCSIERGLKAQGAMNFPSDAQLDQTDVLVIYARTA